MRPFRLLATATSAVLLTAAVVGSPAGAAAIGTGTSSTSTSVVDISVGKDGSVLHLGLLADQSRSTIDPTVTANPEAFARVARVNLSTPLDAVNGLVAGIPAVEARQPGGDQVKEVPGVSASVGLPATPLIPAASIASLNLDATRLTADLGAGAAQSGITAGVTSASLAGGLIAANGAKVNFSTVSAPAASEAVRAVTIDSVTVVDLGALLKGLGIDLSILPVSSVSALLNQLGLQQAVATATGISITGTLQQVVTQLNAAITTLQAQAAATGGTVDATVGAVLGLIGVTTVTTGDVINQTQANALLDQVKADLAGLLTQSVTTLATAPLFSIGGVNVGITTKATDDVNSSVATITGKVGSVKVGTLELLAGTDLLAATDRVKTIVDQANAAISGALSSISPDLAGLVKVSVLSRDSSVQKTGDYVRSLAGITAASATVTPPATLAALISSLTAPASASIAKAIADNGGAALPALETLMSGLQNTLTLGVGVLSSPSIVTIAQVLSASEFRVNAAPATPTTGGELPRTGGTSLLLLGGGAAALGLAARRLLRSTGSHHTNR